MYYKITNKDCEVYKKLHEMRTNEIRMEKENIAKLKEVIPYEWSDFLCYAAQNSFSRVREFIGFRFTNFNESDKSWKKDRDNPSVYVPNNRTKKGREMSQLLSNGLQQSIYTKVFDNLGLEHPYGRFSMPYVEILNDIIILFLDEQSEPNSEDVIEITKTECNRLLKEAQA